MRRPLTALLAMAISFAPGLAAAGAGPSQAGNGALGGPRFPIGALVATGSGEDLRVEAPGTRVEDALRSAIDPTDVRTQMDAVRLLIQGDTGIRLPDLRPAHTRDTASTFHVFPAKLDTLEEPPPEPEPVPEAAGTMSFPSPAGDLSGDGLDDVLSYDLKLPQEVVEIRALRGTDGTQLWKRRLDDVADASAMPASDLTGDGIDDLILIGLEVNSESESVDCPEDGDHCRIDYEAEYTWLTGVLEGTNGKLSWSRRYPATLDYHFLYEENGEAATETVRFEESLTSSNVSIWPMLAGDHDGDGADDLVLEAIDLDYEIELETRQTVVVFEDEGSFEVDSATRAVVVRGKTGDDLKSFSSLRGPTVAVLEPVGNLVGDPKPDLLWQDTTYTNDTYSCIGIAGLEHCSDVPDNSIRFAVQAIDGATLGSVWQKAIDGVDDTYVYSLEADVSGDGADDIAELTLAWDGPTFTTSVVSGRDGSSLWTRTSDADSEFPLVVGDLGAGPGNDILLGSFTDSVDLVSGDVEFGLRFTRVEGSTGQTMFETTRSMWTAPNDASYGILLYMGGMDDADGDGAGDVYAGAIGEIVEFDAEGNLVTTDSDSTAFVESSGEDHLLLQRQTDDPMTFYGVPDIDGDGRADVFEWHYPLDPFADDPRFDVVVQRAEPGATLWSRSFVGDEFWLGTLWTGGDHDGQPGQELLYGDNSKEGGSWKSLVGSLRGTDGTARWLKGGDD